MNPVKEVLSKIFAQLDEEISIEKLRRIKANEAGLIGKTEITLLGQMSLFANDSVVAHLSLAQTADLDAKISADQFSKRKLKELLEKNRLIYDEDSHLIWIPEDSQLEDFARLKNLHIRTIDPESALVSKAIKAREKNLILIRQAIASDLFPKLIERIIYYGGDIEFFT